MLPTFCKWQVIIILTVLRIVWETAVSVTQMIHQISENPLGFRTNTTQAYVPTISIP
jgi:hypothetical protein